MMRLRLPAIVLTGCAALFTSHLMRGAVRAAEEPVEAALGTLSRAGSGEVPPAELRAARDRLTGKGTEFLPRLLEAMDTDDVIAANWLRTAFEEILARELAKEDPDLPVEAFKKFVANPQRQGRVRRRVLRLVEELEPGYEDALVPTLLDDPEFRHDAVDRTMAAADQAFKAKEEERARRLYGKAFDHARDSEQLIQASRRLKQLGEEVSVVEQMGFVNRWYVLGPFDAPEFTGFDREYPPEKGVDLSAEYEGKGGGTIAWEPHETDHVLGQSNLVQAIAAVKEAVGYAYAELECPREQQLELRCGADDNLTVWLNGEKIFARRQWLNGTRLDRFSAPATLRKGTNRLLVKICQGPQHRNPAVPNNWSVQLRFCRPDGAGADFRLAKPEPNE